jgi:hypothetical protein
MKPAAQRLRSSAFALLWGALLILALAWPGRIVGPFDGAPFDGIGEALAFGVVLPALWLLDPRFLRTTRARGLVVALLGWKLVTWTLLPQAGWCGLFAEKSSGEQYRFGPAWDVRTMWESPLPRCSAIVARGYASSEEFPASLMNVPYGYDQNLATGRPELRYTENPRPPDAEYALHISGAIAPRHRGMLSFQTGPDGRLSGSVDGSLFAPAQGKTTDVTLDAGVHDVNLRLDVSGTRWGFIPRWNGRDMFTSVATASTATAHVVPMIQRVGRWIAPMIVLALFGLWLHSASGLLRGAMSATAWVAALSIVTGSLALLGESSYAHLAALPLLSCALIRLPRRLCNGRGAFLLVGVPWLAWIAVRSLAGIGRFTLFTLGDDMLTYQRFAVRIFMQGYWLEGGQPTFWNQPLYRWIVGVFHLLFGDSSVGELYWDGLAMLLGAMFAFRIARHTAGFRAGIVAAAAVLITVTLGPTWYMIGRGLSEIAATGFVYAAALMLMRARLGATRFATGAAVLAVLAFYTRLNHLLFVVGLVALLLPVRLGRSAWLDRVRIIPKRVVAVYAAGIACGVAVFMTRTWYYTGALSLFAGTTRFYNATDLAVTMGSFASLRAWHRALESVLMVVTVSDPPRFDPRAIPVIGGVMLAALRITGTRAVRGIPLAAAIVCLASIAPALFVRGIGYPGRFSIHLIPVAVGIAVGACGSLAAAVTARRNGTTRPVAMSSEAVV